MYIMAAHRSLLCISCQLVVDCVKYGCKSRYTLYFVSVYGGIVRTSLHTMLFQLHMVVYRLNYASRWLYGVSVSVRGGILCIVWHTVFIMPLNASVLRISFLYRVIYCVFYYEPCSQHVASSST